MKRTVENRLKVGTARGIEVVLKAIDTHISNVKVCYAGCYALGGMTGDNGKNAKIQKTKTK